MKNKLVLGLIASAFMGSVIAAEPPQVAVETVTAEKVVKAERKGHGKPEGKHGKKGHRPDHQKMWKEMDTDKDGKVSKEEAIAAASAKFDKMDLNKDGFVTEDEAKEVMKKHKRADGKKPKGPRPERKAAPTETAPVAPVAEQK